nr:efflux RND transporter periplasmic adaptor subunit [Palleronia pontilimi]
MSFPICLVLAATPIAAQQEGAQPSGPTIELPVFGDVPVPDFLANLLGIEAEASGGGQGGGGQSAPPAVTFATAERRAVAESYSFLGRVEPIERVSVQTRVPGFIDAVAFSGGETVESGDLLFQIEQAQYEAELQAAQARAESARAQAANAERSLARAQELRDSGTVSAANLDDAAAAFEAAQGDVLQAESAVRQAQLNLDYTTIKAPISGKMSQPFSTRGNFVSTATGPIADLTQLDPIWGVFALGENRLIQWQRLGIGGTDVAPVEEQDADRSAAADGLSISGYDLKLLLPDGSTYAEAGELSFVGNSIDPSTGTVQVRVAFPNPDGLLLPNQNVTLTVVESDPPEYPVIPQAAVQLGRDGRAVWIVKDDDTVSRVPIEVQSIDSPGDVAVTRGLEGGERVIVRGTMSLQDGATVDPRMAGDGGAGASGAPGQ